ncbi:tetratricopeptide repeat protein [Acidisphaera sp. S103]|uniref:tetratricopeptide repeat protein n=1 Tax=Acidisphaera sp. S103 TaxID=1747223 RepID=UPI00131B5871|nr:tetratricopeptide repeat protein [Acidisphaera sp. S103]
MQGQRPKATTSIGFTDLRGLTVDQLTGPSEETARWLQAAARFGVVEGQTALGQILLDGHGIARDRCAAARWFSIAAEAGHAPAINMLGRCCELGWGVAVDLVRAADCYRRAAEAGLDWGQYNFANLLLRGRGVERDRKAALGLYRRAAEQGHAKSINMVGRFMEEGWEMPRDARGAAEWYRRAAEAGDFRGQYNLASVLALAGDIIQAEVWLNRALESATAGFLTLMSERLANSAEPRLRRIGAIAAGLAAAR